MLKGIDVSSYQRFDNYDMLNDTNQAFVFIKASESMRQDPMYKIHNASFAKTKLLKGAYHFLRFSHSGAEQAKVFINTVGNSLAAFDLPPVLDIEDVSENLALAATEIIIKEWLDTVEAQYKVKPIIYTGPWYWKDTNRLGDSRKFSDYPLWVSAYASSYPPPFGGWTTPLFWQYKSDGLIQGLRGQIDLNQFLGDIAALWKYTAATTPSQYSLTGDKLFAIQHELKKKVNTSLTVDGTWGPNTLAALTKWQVANGFPSGDSFDAIQWQSLFDLTGAGSSAPIIAATKIGQPVFPEPGVVMAELLNIRKQAGLNSAMVAAPLPKGKSLTILEENNGWYRVKTQIEGWVNKNFVTIQN